MACALRLLSFAVAALLLLTPALGRAQDAPPLTGRPFGTDEAPPPGAQPAGPHVVMRLDYTAAGGCPDEQVTRAAVAAQVRRWDPFAPNAPWRLTVQIVRRGSGYEGSAELRDVTGAVEWSRVLAPRARCFDLVEDLAVKIALKINPPAPPSPTAPAPVPPPEPVAAPEPAPPPKVAEPPKPARVALRLGVGTWMDLATAPRPAVGLTADVGFRVSWFSLAGEIHWDPPAGASAMEGVDVSTALVLGALVPCGHAGWFVGCLVGELGQFRGSITGAGAMPDRQATLYGLAGARIGVEIPVVTERLYVRLAANLLGALGRPRLRLTPEGQEAQTAWESAAFTGGFGAGLVAAF